MKKAFNRFAKKHGTDKAYIEFKDQITKRDIQTVEFEVGYGRTGFPSYSITSTRTKIRNAEKRIEKLKAMNTREVTDFTINDIQVMEEDGRVKVFFPYKPDQETRTKIKGYGVALKWSRNNEAWVRKLTPSIDSYFYNSLKTILKNSKPD